MIFERLFERFSESFLLIGDEVGVTDREIDHQLIRPHTLSNHHMSKHSNLRLVVIGREAAVLTERLDSRKHLLHLVTRQITRINIQDFRKFTLLVKTYLSSLLHPVSERNIFSKTILDFIAITSDLGTGRSVQDMDMRKIAETVLGEVFFDQKLLVISHDLSLAATTTVTFGSMKFLDEGIFVMGTFYVALCPCRIKGNRPQNIGLIVVSLATQDRHIDHTVRQDTSLDHHFATIGSGANTYPAVADFFYLDGKKFFNFGTRHRNLS